MGLDEVAKILKENKGKWMSSRQIANKTSISIHNISVSLQRLKKYEKKLEVKQQSPFEGGYLWRLK